MFLVIFSCRVVQASIKKPWKTSEGSSHRLWRLCSVHSIWCGIYERCSTPQSAIAAAIKASAFRCFCTAGRDTAAGICWKTVAEGAACTISWLQLASCYFTHRKLCGGLSNLSIPCKSHPDQHSRFHLRAKPLPCFCTITVSFSIIASQTAITSEYLYFHSFLKTPNKININKWSYMRNTFILRLHYHF